MEKSEQERIEKAAREYCKDSPQIIFEFRGYMNGATAENERLTKIIEDLWIKIRNLQDAKLRDAETRGNVNRFG